jgi:hypothetical protein
MLAATVSVATLHAQAPDPALPRPGAVLVTEIMGKAFVVVGDQRKPIKVEDRLRVGSIVETERKSLLTVMLSNGATLQLGDEAELEIEEFGQAAIPMNTKIAELKEEPTISRTRLRLLRGDVVIDVKPLKVSRGSSFLLTLPAGTVRLGDGGFRAMVRMSELGLGVCTLEVKRGAAEFELAMPGAAFAPVPAGRKLAFAIELDKATGVVKVGEMPKGTPPPKK